MAPALLIALMLSGVEVLSDDPHPSVVTLSGPLATGPNDRPLYILDDRTPCTDECLTAWPALAAAPTDKPVGDWSPSQGQWTYKGKFVHTFSNDRTATRASGDGIGNKWFPIRNLGRLPQVPTPPEAKVGKAGSTFLLTDYRGHALYTFARDGKAPACRTECLEVWPPLRASELAQPVGAWMPVDRPDGIRQWAYRGRLLYTFSEDMLPADMNGADVGGVWKTVRVTAKDAAVSPIMTAGAKPPGRD